RDVRTPRDAGLVLSKLIELEPRNLEARELRRQIQMHNYERDTTLNKPILALKTQSILSKATDDGTEPLLRLEIAEEALELNPYHHKANLLLADAARQLSWGPMVTLAYETLCRRYPGNRGYELELAHIYYQHEEPRRALAIYEAILEEDPDDLDAHEAAVRLERELEETGEAGEAPPEPELPSDRVVEELESQLKELETEYNCLQKDIQRLSRLDQSTRDLRDELGQRVDMAHLDLLEAETLRHPEDLEITYHLAQAREKVGLYLEAIDAYRELLEDPDLQEEALLAMTACLVCRSYQQHAYAMPPADGPGPATGDTGTTGLPGPEPAPPARSISQTPAA
ncbi:MAG: tetratricopeptide repeat protein, partial [Verrucomicrobiota bacterium]